MARPNNNVSEERRVMMLESPPLKVIPKMALPMMIAMLVDSVYNLADTFFVSSIGETATAAVAVNDSFMHILLAVSSSFAFGASSYLSRLLGAKKDDQASKVASSTMCAGLAVAFLTVAILWPLRRAVVLFVGSTQEALKYSVDYATWILLAFPFSMANSILNQTLKSEGNTKYASIGTISGCVINCILDPIFIKGLGLEVAGAAGATAISKVISFCVLVTPFIRKRTVIVISPKNIHFNKHDFFEVAKMGIPNFLRTTLMSVGGILTNNAAKAFGTSVLAAISIANKLYRFISSAIMGFAQGFTPVAGYCCGAKKYKRVKSLYLTTCKIGAIAGIVLGALMFIGAEPLIDIFNKSMNPMVTEIGMLKLRVLCIGIVPHIFTMVTNHLFQAMGKPVQNTLLSMSRQLIFLIPMILILPKHYGAAGVACAQGIADVLAGILLALPMAIGIVRKFDKLGDSDEI